MNQWVWLPLSFTDTRICFVKVEVASCKLYGNILAIDGRGSMHPCKHWSFGV